ncbi:hypothetical protein [Candidatus Paracaedibacter symbiosus]|uniref:hypothetical protein n=1 Tax=Candidatus Paracaedibacter symbiosus TaxID=244582 RepID=UPI0005098A35|nr:hypothetical protein [Candidatus Paracaedibacter symbiosus]
MNYTSVAFLMVCSLIFAPHMAYSAGWDSGNISKTLINPSQTTQNLLPSQPQPIPHQKWQPAHKFNCDTKCTDIVAMECQGENDTGYYQTCLNTCSPHLNQNQAFHQAIQICKAKIHQTRRYLGKVIGIKYKDLENGHQSKDVRGFFVQILNQKNEEFQNPSIVGVNDMVFLPYVVVIKPHLVTDPTVRNSNGTPIDNLDVTPNTLIEFNNVSWVPMPLTNGQNKISLHAISARPSTVKDLSTEENPSITISSHRLP